MNKKERLEIIVTVISRRLKYGIVRREAPWESPVSELHKNGFMPHSRDNFLQHIFRGNPQGRGVDAGVAADEGSL